MNDFITIRISNGITCLGSSALFLQREGFLYWENPFYTNMPEESHFIPYYELNKKQVRGIIKYVHSNNLLNYTQDFLAIPLEGMVVKGGIPCRIYFIDHDEDKYTVLYYHYCNAKIDKLIKMMNQYIPIHDRKNQNATTL